LKGILKPSPLRTHTPVQASAVEANAEEGAKSVTAPPATAHSVLPTLKSTKPTTPGTSASPQPRANVDQWAYNGRRALGTAAPGALATLDVQVNHVIDITQEAETTAHHGAAQQVEAGWQRFLKGTGAYLALRQGDSAAFLQQLRQHELPELLVHLDNMQTSVNALQAHNLAPGVGKALTQSLHGIRLELGKLQHDHTAAQRAVGAALTTVLGFTPLALLMPYKLNQLKYLMFQIAFYAKTALYTAGGMVNPNTGPHDWVDLGVARHLQTGLLALMYAAPAFSTTPTTQALRENPVFNAGTAVFATGALVTSYYAHKINALFQASQQKYLGGGTPHTLAELPTAAQPIVANLQAQAVMDKKKLADAERTFEGVLNAAINGKTSKAAEKYAVFVHQLRTMAAAGCDLAAPEKPANHELIAKAGVAALGISAGWAATALMAPAWAGVSDYAPHAAFATVLLTLTTLNPEMNLDNILVEFANFVGLNLIGLPVLMADKAFNFINPYPEGTDPHNIEKITQLALENLKKPSFWIVTGLLTVANITLDIHLARLAAKGAQTLKRIAHGDEDETTVTQNAFD
jgi:hypothetical protein